MATAPWLKHLEADEQVVWSAATSLELRLKELGARRQASLLACVVASGLGLWLAWNLAQTPGSKPGWWLPDLSGYLVYWPLYIVGISICVGVAATSLQLLVGEISPEKIYAATSGRLLVIDEAGTITDQMASADIADVRMLDLATGTILQVQRKQGVGEQRKIIIRNVSDVKSLDGILRSWLQAAQSGKS